MNNQNNKGQEYRQNSLRYWNQIHERYPQTKMDNWLKPFDFLFHSCTTPILDLGCGNGNDVLYLIQNQKQVIACDQSPKALEIIKTNFPEASTQCFNFLDGLPFEKESFEIIIADLSLHYFRTEDTFKILHEIWRILKNPGFLLFRVNSVQDWNHGFGQGQEIEPHLYETKDKRLKRFFDDQDIAYFFQDFDVIDLKEESMERYEREKKVYVGLVKKEI